MKINIEVPTTLKDITLDQYQRITRLEGDDEFMTRKMIEIVCDIDQNTIDMLNLETIEMIMTKIQQAIEANDDSFDRIIELDGVKYGFNPNLEDITFGEFVDLDRYLQNWRDMHKAIAVLYRPIIAKVGDHYAIKKYEGTENAETMKKMPMTNVNGAVVFFWTLRNELKRHLKTSSDQTKDQTIQLEQ